MQATKVILVMGLLVSTMANAEVKYPMSVIGGSHSLPVDECDISPDTKAN